MKLMKDWYKETSSGYETKRDVIGTLQSWYNKGNLKIVYGKAERKVEDTFGLPYTSTSDFAALWNTNVTAVYKKNDRWFFDGVAVSVDRKIVVVFTVLDDEGNEVGTKYIVIG